MVRPGREKLSGTVEIDETYVGGDKIGKRGRTTLTRFKLCRRYIKQVTYPSSNTVKSASFTFKTADTEYQVVMVVHKRPGITTGIGSL